MCLLIVEVVVGHGADTRIAPHVDGSLYHVDDGIDRQDDAQYGNRGIDA